MATVPSERAPRPVADPGHGGFPDVDSIAPLVDDLLLPTALDDGLVIALGDARGRLRHIGGDGRARSRIEEIGFAVGEDWSTSHQGTNAPGTAILRGAPVSVRREEHTRPEVHAFSCSAAPILHPSSGEILGVLDLSGHDNAADPHCLALVRATASAAAREFDRIRRAGTAGPDREGPPSAVLRLVHRGRPGLEIGGMTTPLTTRHAALLALLATEPGGLTSAEIGALAYPDGASASTVRVELLRLKRALEAIPGAPGLAGKPYRLTSALEVDALRVVDLVGRGDVAGALDLYRGRGTGLADTTGLTGILDRASGSLREAMLADADADTLLRYLELPEAEDDRAVWEVALQILPPRAPQRSIVVAHLEALGIDEAS